jgi:LacI family transcriptional regulator
LLVASHLPEHARPLALDWAKFSAVKIDCLPHEPVLNHVTNDHRAIVQLAMARIKAAGYRRIGLVMPPGWDECSNLGWSAGFLAEQQRLVLKDRIPILHFPGAQVGTEEAGREPSGPTKVLADWIEHYRPEVLLSMARLVQPHLAKLGLAVPRDLAFVEIYLDPDGQTAGVRHNCERVGALAVEILVAQLQQNTVGIPELPVATLVGGTWFDGETLPFRAPTPARRSARPVL